MTRFTAVPDTARHDDLSVRLLASGGLALAMTARRECGFDVFCRPPDRLDRPT